MSEFTFHCNTCGKYLFAPRNLLGKKVQCPACKSLIQLPAAETQENAPSSSPPKKSIVVPPPSSFDAYLRSQSSERQGGEAMVSGGAIASLVLGIIGFLGFGPLAFIPAVICGHVVRSRIKHSGGALRGEGMAITGLVLGYIGLALSVVAGLLIAISIPSFMRIKRESERSICRNNLSMINDAKYMVALEENYSMGDLVSEDELIRHIDGGSMPVCPSGGRYIIKPLGEEDICTVHSLPERR